MKKIEKDELQNKICFGTGIVHDYRYGNYIPLRKIKYYVNNFLNNRKQFNSDIHFSKIVDVAMANKCNFFDTSRAYGGAEYILGKSLKKYKREDYIIATKLCNKDQYNGTVRQGFEKSLKELDLEYIDLYLMHWPVTDCFIDSWLEMEKLYEEGLVRSIGVCNFNEHHLKELFTKMNVCPIVNQIECHPLFTQNELRKFCKENDINVMAYTSTARMNERLYKTVLVPISKKYNKTIPQIILRWHQLVGNIPIVNSANINHMKSNLSLNDFTLTNDEIVMINNININSRLRYDPDNCDFTQL